MSQQNFHIAKNKTFQFDGKKIRLLKIAIFSWKYLDNLAKSKQTLRIDVKNSTFKDWQFFSWKIKIKTDNAVWGKKSNF